MRWFRDAAVSHSLPDRLPVEWGLCQLMPIDTEIHCIPINNIANGLSLRFGYTNF
jgi:hypothetical protein